ncbi:ATP-binding protein [Actinomadura algeriensis]|uniref:Anti-sigma regulatory factor (Ser/Thr protein kinase) n=1 Tax=Actinomadura algeriensis TaxID=1679523 RepID=A0ABR9K4Z8_9ACTN|nr:ATP-binding protein [Actinomadura algeriensis]MBE1537910.1 anti-sigma regulatory factor (Ser/Thr protein kinase) [Actinomadura algeriensis]
MVWQGFGEAGSAAEVVRRGGCAVRTLPVDGTCAATARRFVRDVLAELRLPDGVVGDAVTMVSELATNVFVHTLGGRVLSITPTVGLPEVRVYGRESGTELVVKVFDSGSWTGAPPCGALRPEVEAEGGRGLEIVDALVREHGGRWGLHRSRSSLGLAPVSGKVVYFGLPVHGRLPVAPVDDCRRAVRELARVLAAQGIERTHLSVGWGMAVLSVRAGITAWVRDGVVSVTLPPVGTRKFATSDLADVAEEIVRCGEELDA